jgi:hypothetical protein
MVALALALPRKRVASGKSRCIILVLVSRLVSHIRTQIDASDQEGGLGYIILMLLSSPCLRNPCEILSCGSADYSISSLFGRLKNVNQPLRIPRQEHRKVHLLSFKVQQVLKNLCHIETSVRSH